jgi:transcriptional regulator with XRE-family HTH domain
MPLAEFIKRKQELEEIQKSTPIKPIKNRRRLVLKEMGFSITQLAKACGLSMPFLSACLLDKKEMSVKTSKLLEKHTNINFLYFLLDYSIAVFFLMPPF